MEGLEGRKNERMDGGKNGWWEEWRDGRGKMVTWMCRCGRFDKNTLNSV